MSGSLRLDRNHTRTPSLSLALPLFLSSSPSASLARQHEHHHRLSRRRRCRAAAVGGRPPNTLRSSRSAVSSSSATAQDTTAQHMAAAAAALLPRFTPVRAGNLFVSEPDPVRCDERRRRDVAQILRTWMTRAVPAHLDPPLSHPSPSSLSLSLSLAQSWFGNGPNERNNSAWTNGNWLKVRQSLVGCTRDRRDGITRQNACCSPSCARGSIISLRPLICKNLHSLEKTATSHGSTSPSPSGTRGRATSASCA